MDNYISREIAIATLQNSHERQAETLREESLLAEDIRLLKELPAADVRPVVRGEWIRPTYIGGRAHDIPHCSACKGVPCGVDEHTRFCPYCGADMRGGSNG